MPTVLTIGYSDYLVRSDRDLSAIVRALSGAIVLEGKYEDGRYFFWPRDNQERETQVSIRTVRADQILPAKPGTIEVSVDPPAPRNLELLPSMLPIVRKKSKR